MPGCGRGGPVRSAPLGGSGGGCFVKGTLVYTQIGLKRIEELSIGDMVLSYDDKNKHLEYERIVAVIKAVRKDLVKIYHKNTNDIPIIASPNHKFYIVDKGWIHAAEIQAGDKILDKSFQEIEVVKAEHVIKSIEEEVYNIEVENLHNYFVGFEGILTQNQTILKSPFDPVF